MYEKVKAVAFAEVYRGGLTAVLRIVLIPV